MREPPATWGADPSRFSLPELTALHEELGRWLEDALAAAPDDAPSDDLYNSVYAATARLSVERVLRQQGEVRGH